MLWSSGLNWYLYCYQPFVFFGEQPIGNINEAFVNATRIYLFFFFTRNRTSSVYCSTPAHGLSEFVRV